MTLLGNVLINIKASMNYDNERTNMRQPVQQNQPYQQPQEVQPPQYAQPQQPDQKKSGGKGLMITTIILSALTLLAIIGFIIFMVLNKDDSEQKDTPKTEVKATHNHDDGNQQMVYSISSDGFLNIREQPTSHSSIVGVLYTGGDGAKLLGQQGKWYNVEYQGRQGYVNSSYATCSSAKPTSTSATTSHRKVYYVVLGSYDNLEYARSYANSWSGPNSNRLSVYRTIVYGTVKFRVCNFCSYSMSSAKDMVQLVANNTGQTAWVWPSDGLADCVYSVSSPLSPNEP